MPAARVEDQRKLPELSVENERGKITELKPFVAKLGSTIRIKNVPAMEIPNAYAEIPTVYELNMRKRQQARELRHAQMDLEAQRRMARYNDEIQRQRDEPKSQKSNRSHVSEQEVLQMEQVDESFQSLRTKSRENTRRGRSKEGPKYRSTYAKQLVETL